MSPTLLSIVPRGYIPWLQGGLELTARSVLETLIDLPAAAHLAAGVSTSSRTLPARIIRKMLGPYRRSYAVDRHQVHTDLYHPLDVAKLVKRLNPSAVICHVAGHNPHIRTIMELDIPTLFYVHGSRFDNVFSGIENMKKHRFAAESSFISDLVTTSTGQPTEIIRPILDPLRFSVNTHGDSVLVVNPDPLKGGEHVVRIADALPHRHFLVVGGWSHNRRHKEVINIERSLKVLPNVERIAHMDDMREAFRRSRCLLMPCVVEEAYGRAAAEALIAGLPVLASDRGALPETVGAGGVTLPPDAPLGIWISKLEAMFTNQTYYQSLVSAASAQADEESRQPAYATSALRRVVTELME